MMRPSAVVLLLLATSMMWLTCASDATITTIGGEEFPPTVKLGRRQLLTTKSELAESPEGKKCPSSYSDLEKFASCYPAVTSNHTSPSKSCCSTVKSWSLSCLCSTYLEYRSEISGYVDTNKVVKVPRECGYDIPNGYKCGVPLFGICTMNPDDTCCDSSLE